MSLLKIQASLKTGKEKLLLHNNELPYSLLDFWRWSVSDILSNATRGRFAEFIVATATNVDIKKVRDEWGAFDLTTQEGVKVEVKSAAYLQSWDQREPSKIRFSTKISRPWDSDQERRSNIAVRSADVYVFCLLHHEHKPTCDPLNMAQWEFYVVPTQAVNSNEKCQQSISLKTLKNLVSSVSYQSLNQAIRDSFEIYT